MKYTNSLKQIQDISKLIDIHIMYLRVSHKQTTLSKSSKDDVYSL